MKRSKYGNKKSVGADGFVYDSKRERSRYAQLLLLQRAGLITELKRQVRFELIPTQREQPTISKRGTPKVGRVIERAVDYIADFVYIDENKQLVVEDAKGKRTKDYIIKRKLMLYFHKIRVREV